MFPASEWVFNTCYPLTEELCSLPFLVEFVENRGLVSVNSQDSSHMLWGQLTFLVKELSLVGV